MKSKLVMVTMKKPLNTCTIPELRQVRKNALRAGNQQVAQAALMQLAESEAAAHTDPLERKFWEATHLYEEISGRLAMRSRQKVTRVGVRKTLADWVKQKTSSGQERLFQLGRTDLLAEYIVLAFPDQFLTEIVEAAKAKLARLGLPLTA